MYSYLFLMASLIGLVDSADDRSPPMTADERVIALEAMVKVMMGQMADQAQMINTLTATLEVTERERERGLERPVERKQIQLTAQSGEVVELVTAADARVLPPSLTVSHLLSCRGRLR